METTKEPKWVPSVESVHHVVALVTEPSDDQKCVVGGNRLLLQDAMTIMFWCKAIKSALHSFNWYRHLYPPLQFWDACLNPCPSPPSRYQVVWTPLPYLHLPLNPCSSPPSRCKVVWTPLPFSHLRVLNCFEGLSYPRPVLSWLNFFLPTFPVLVTATLHPPLQVWSACLNTLHIPFFPFLRYTNLSTVSLLQF